VSIQVVFDEVVTVTGFPQLTLETGAVDAVVNYVSGTGTNTLTFTYTIIAGENSTDLDYASTTALALNGGTIQDAASNNATLTMASPGAVNSLGANKAIVVDTTGPTVGSVTSTTAAGYYNAGDVISIQVSFDEVVTVTGVPTLILETGATDAVVNYTSGTGTSTLTFDYTITVGENSLDLDYANIGSLAFAGGNITDAVLNVATLTLPVPAAAGSLGANEALVVDTVDPATPSAGDLDVGSDTGTVTTDDITTDTTPTLSGTGVEAGAAVKIYSDQPVANTLVCSTTADGAGAWSCTTSVLAVGDHDLTVTQTDLAGNVSLASTALTVTIDNTDATGSFSTAAFVTNNPAVQTLTFTVSDAAVGIEAASEITVSSSVSGALVPVCTPAVAFPT
jgi:hypothetical protein